MARLHSAIAAALFTPQICLCIFIPQLSNLLEIFFFYYSRNIDNFFNEWTYEGGVYSFLQDVRYRF